MTPWATVLYEDSMSPGAGGAYPLHDLIVRMLEDDVGGPTWQLHKGVGKNPRRGIGNILNDVKDTDLIAGAEQLFLLIDRDVIAEHLKLPHSATDDQVVEAIETMSDAPAKLSVYFLMPNCEGLIRAIQGCEPAFMAVNVAAALTKKLNDRDLVFNGAKSAGMQALRTCVRVAQPGLDALVKELAARAGTHSTQQH